jgi:hypothetical protein
VARRRALVDVAREGDVFDPELRVGEDVDLVWRLVVAGWRVRYQPDVPLAHQEPDGWLPLAQRRYRYGTSSAALARRHPDNVAPLLVHPWYSASVATLLAGRPALATAALAGTVHDTRRAVQRAGLPPRRLAPATFDGVRQTWLGIGRYATQFAAPALLAALAAGRPRHRVAPASLLAGPAVAGWLRSDRRLDPVRYALASVADDIAYGSGVLAGCLRQRTARPLVPRRARRKTSW